MPGAETKRKILEASNELFSIHGYDDVSMRDIAEKVGITEGAIYRYYEGKKKILDEIIETLGRKYNEVLHSVNKEQIDQYLETETARQILERCKLQFKESDFQFVAYATSILLQEHLTNPSAKDIAMQQYNQITERVKYVIEKLMEKGSIPQFNASLYSEVWSRFTMSTLVLWASLSNSGISPDKAEVNYSSTLDWLIELALSGKAQ